MPVIRDDEFLEGSHYARIIVIEVDNTPYPVSPEAQEWEDAVERLFDRTPLTDEERARFTELFNQPVPLLHTKETEDQIVANGTLLSPYKHYGDWEKLGLTEDDFRRSMLANVRDHA